jgi:hypothetical protein
MQVRTTFSQSFHQRLGDSLAFLGLTLATVSAAQAQTATTFEEAISPDYSYAEAVQQTSDGGYVIGATVSIPPYAALVAKFDSSGNLQWQKQYQSSIGSSALYALSQTSDGGYVWAGYLQDSSTYAEYVIVAKLDSSGDIQWQKTSGIAEYATDVRQTTDGGYIVGGVTPPNGSLNRPRLDREVGLLGETTVAKGTWLLTECNGQFGDPNDGRRLCTRWISQGQCVRREVRF